MGCGAATTSSSGHPAIVISDGPNIQLPSGYAVSASARKQLLRRGSVHCPALRPRDENRNVQRETALMASFRRWLAEAEPEIVCLQKLKVPDDKFPEPAIRELGIARSGTARRAGTASPYLRANPQPTENASQPTGRSG